MTTLNPETARRFLDMLAGAIAQDPMLPNAGPYETAYGLCQSHSGCIGTFKTMLTADHAWSSDWVQEGHISLAEIVAALGAPLTSATDDDIFAELGLRYPGGNGARLPLSGFNWVARVRPQSSAEPVVIRKFEGTIQVLLVDRPDGADAHQGTCQLPSLFRLTGDSLKDSVTRGLQTKAGITGGALQFVGIINDTHEPRGHVEHHVWLVTDPSGPATGQWVDVTQLPENLVPQHFQTIALALEVLSGGRAPGFALEYRLTTDEERAGLSHWFEGDITNYPSGHPAIERIRIAEMGQEAYWRQVIARQVRRMASAPVEEASPAPVQGWRRYVGMIGDVVRRSIGG